VALGLGLFNFAQWATVRVQPAAVAGWVFELLAKGVKYAILLSEDKTSALTILAGPEIRAWVLHQVDRGLPHWNAEHERSERECAARVRSVAREALSRVPGVTLREGEAVCVSPNDLWAALNARQVHLGEVAPVARLDARLGSWASDAARREGIAQWLCAVAERASAGPSCTVSLGRGGETWEHLEVREERDWLSALWGADLPGWQEADPRGRTIGPKIDSLMVLLNKGAQTLAIRTTTEDEVQAFVVPTATLVDRLAARNRLDDALGQINSVRLVGPSQQGDVIGADLVFESAFQMDSLPAPSSEESRREWMRRLVRALDAASGPDAGATARFPRDVLGAYDLSLGTLSPVPWTTIFAYDPDWLAALWEAGGLSHILIRRTEAGVILGVCTLGTSYRASICPSYADAASERSM
jgi:hypothetical protein